MNSNWMEEQFSLIGKKAIVTGASKGIGANIAISLAKAGADIVLVGRSESSLSATVQSVLDQGRAFEIVITDFSRPEEIPHAFSKLNLASIDILINNAGSISRATATQVTPAEWHRILDTNLNSVFALTQLVGNAMLKRGYGRIVNIASLLSFQGGINVSSYTASKHGLVGLTKALANEWGSQGLNVNAIAPGYIETDNTEALRNDTERQKSIIARIPLGRWGRPEDIGPVAVFLASNAARYINGEVLTVDGGWMSR